MNREKDVKAVKEIIDKTYGEKSIAVLQNRLRWEYRIICNEEVAQAIINAGYRNADEVRKETAKELFAKLMPILGKRSIRCPNWNGQQVGVVMLDWLLADIADIARQYGVEIDE